MHGHSDGEIARAEERITDTRNPAGTRHTHTTSVSDEPRRGGSGATWVIVLLLIVLAAVAIWFFSGMRGSEVAKDTAIGEAASDVGAAAGQVGDAAQEAAGAAREAADNN